MELKPCPSCGEKKIFVKHRMLGPKYECSNNFCAVSGPEEDDIRGTKWNALPRREDTTPVKSEAISRRDLFAAAALTGLLMNCEIEDYEVVQRSLEIADAMIKAMEENKQGRGE